MIHENTFRLASDIGGTFTDTVLIDANDTVVAATKTPTTPRAPAEGALLGAQHVMRTAGIDGIRSAVKFMVQRLRPMR